MLRDNVDGEGRVAFRRLVSAPEPLYLAVAAVAGAHPGPARNDRLAFSLNAYNTLAMYDIVDHGAPHRLDAIDRIEIFRLTRFVVAGHATPLSSFAAGIAAQGDPRVLFALSCMAVSCPRLSRVPFDAAGLDAQLDAAARAFLASPRNVRFDPASSTVLLSAVLSRLPQKGPALLATINRYRAEPVPETARVVFMRFDWTTVDQPGNETVPP